ncbi:hypothetical protein [Planctobacterium marinum]|uniref:Uncharacterized protein n=1 Tax=Planctobacterium marinum TaxID=1631968 RepID=A0AA48KR89_9ALTE|nr:hypothetical protein MACH26_13880 [Planctobacterium marinum]
MSKVLKFFYIFVCLIALLFYVSGSFISALLIAILAGLLVIREEVKLLLTRRDFFHMKLWQTPLVTYIAVWRIAGWGALLALTSQIVVSLVFGDELASEYLDNIIVLSLFVSATASSYLHRKTVVQFYKYPKILTDLGFKKLRFPFNVFDFFAVLLSSFSGNLIYKSPFNYLLYIITFLGVFLGWGMFWLKPEYITARWRLSLAEEVQTWQVAPFIEILGSLLFWSTTLLLTWFLVSVFRMLCNKITVFTDWLYLISDKRALVVYLRSFKLDAPLTQKTFRTTKSIEESIAYPLRRIGKTIAISNPGIEGPNPGFFKIPSTDEKWQALVTKMLSSSSAVVMLIGDSNHIQWELEAALTKERLQNVLLLFGQTPSESTINTLRMCFKDEFKDLEEEQLFMNTLKSNPLGLFYETDCFVFIEATKHTPDAFQLASQVFVSGYQL